jgi:FdhD protein
MDADSAWLTRPGSLERLGTADALVPHSVVRWERGVATERLDMVAEECPVTIVYNDVPHVVMMATPTNLIDFVTGFSLTEGLVRSVDDLTSIAAVPHARGIEMQVTVAAACMAEIEGRTRRISGRTGCGVCGSESVDAVLRPVPAVGPGRAVSGRVIHGALDQLVARQELNRQAGAVHAAGWSSYAGDVDLVREDVGRHNALDKLIGALRTRGTDPQSGFVVVTSRASFEMVHKAAMLGTSLLVTVSGATGLAVRMAHEANLTLCGFSRGESHVVYTHAWRVTP